LPENLEDVVENLLLNPKGSDVFTDFVVINTQEEILLIPGRPFLRDVNARIDVGAGRIQFSIGQRNNDVHIPRQGRAMLHSAR
jgi:hypothetical protein